MIILIIARNNIKCQSRRSNSKWIGSPYKLVQVIDNRCNYRLKLSQFVERIPGVNFSLMTVNDSRSPSQNFSRTQTFREGLWNESKSRYPLGQETRGTRAMAIGLRCASQAGR